MSLQLPVRAWPHLRKVPPRNWLLPPEAGSGFEDLVQRREPKCGPQAPRGRGRGAGRPAAVGTSQHRGGEREEAALRLYCQSAGSRGQRGEDHFTTQNLLLLNWDFRHMGSGGGARGGGWGRRECEGRDCLSPESCYLNKAHCLLLGGHQIPPCHLLSWALVCKPAWNGATRLYFV